MLQNLTIEDFKSYKHAVLELSPLTVLIGANASGKSNALEALRLLAWIAEGNKLNAVKYAIQDGSNVVRGRVRDLPRGEEDSFRLSCRAPLSKGTVSPNMYDQFSISLKATDDDELHITDERVTGPNATVPLYEVVGKEKEAGHDLLVAYNNFARGGVKPKVACMDQQAIFIQLESTARYSVSHKTSQKVIPFVSDKLQQWLGGIHFLDPAPSSMRDYSFKSEILLHQNGANISGVLYNICFNGAGKESVLSFIQSLPEQNIKDIDFVETPRAEVMVNLLEGFGERSSWYDAALLSDGTLRVLAIAAVLLSAPSGSLVVIEEIDNGVHPSRAEMLLERISSAARERDLRVLISTHNPALLDALPQKAVGDVVFCYRDPKMGSSQLVSLRSLEYFPEIVSQGHLGELLTRGVIDRYAKTLPDKSDRRKKALEWLGQLRGSGE